MSGFTLTFSTDNAAFDDGNQVGEIARILTDIADNLRVNGTAAFDGGVIRIRDYNGNRIGYATLEGAE